MTTTTLAPTVTIVTGDTTAHAALAQIEAEVRSEIIKPDPMLRVLFLGLVAGVHVFVLGEPGVAKTMTAQRILARIDSRTFDVLMRRDTLPPEVLGPTDPSLIDQGKLVRKVDGYLPAADDAILDEGFKANSMVLNSLLRLMNEGTYTQDGQTVVSPLSFVVLLSNELPAVGDVDDLSAFYDRIPLRVVHEPVLDKNDLLDLLALPEPDPAPATLLTMDELRSVRTEVRAIPLDDGARAAIADIARSLSAKGIALSPRRIKKTVRVVQAAAWLAGADTATASHVVDVVHMLWDQPDQRATVTELVMTTCAPNEAEIITLSDTWVQVIDQVDAALAAGDIDKMTEATTRCYAVGAELLTIEAKGVSAPGQARLDAIRTDIETRYRKLYDKVMGGGDADEAAEMLWRRATRKMNEA